MAGAAFSSIAFKAPRFFAYFFSNAKSKASPASDQIRLKSITSFLRTILIKWGNPFTSKDHNDLKIKTKYFYEYPY